MFTSRTLGYPSRTLGYPSSDVPARWVNELYPDRRRIFTSKTSPVAPFEPEVKRQAVMALCTRQVSASEIAWRIGVSRAVLYKNLAYVFVRLGFKPLNPPLVTVSMLMLMYAYISINEG